jgi:hypothetical protein
VLDSSLETRDFLIHKAVTLDQHIGVRIPGGQPNLFNNLRSSILPKSLSRPKSRPNRLVNTLELPCISGNT